MALLAVTIAMQIVVSDIDEYSISLVLSRADHGAMPWAHVQQIEAARSLYPERWKLTYGDQRSPYGILLFRIRGNDGKPADAVKLPALSAPKALAQ